MNDTGERAGANRGADGPAIIGVDVGTSSIKAVAFDPVGRKLAAAARPTPTQRMPTGGEWDPDTIFDTALAVLGDVALQLDGRPVAGIAATSVGESCVLIDEAGRAVAPSIAWFDRRTVPEAESVKEAVGDDRVFAITGVGVEFNFTLVKLLWMRKHWPDAFVSGRHVMLMADWIAYRLSGVAATDPTLAARTQYYDSTANTWSAEMLALLDRGTDFPAPVMVGGTPLGPVKPQMLAATGLAGTPIVGVGGHDHIVGAMACGLYRPGTLIDSMGTAEALILGSTRPVDDIATIRRGYLQAPVEPGRMYWVGGSVFTCGGAMEWARALTGGADTATLIAEAEAVPPGSEGVVFVPHVGNGVSAPNPDLNARGAFLGLTVQTTRGALYRSVLEGLAMQSRMILDDMARVSGVTPPTGSPRLTGGGSRNPVFMEIKANVFGRPIIIVDEPESTALGAALLGGVAAGVYADVETAVSGLVRKESTVEPDAASAARYDSLRETVFEPASGALKPVESALTVWQAE